jgi:lipoprotein-anchoring transpeptidase ErfK/SrfK
VAALLAEAEKKEQQGQPVAARKLYGQALARAADAAQRATIARKAVALAERTILSPSLSPGETEAQWYEVQAGDVLVNIGPRFRIPYELIKRVNGLPSDTIRAGQKLKVVKGPFRARITKGPFTLELWLRDTLVKTYPVAIGVGDSTPSASYTVSVKQKNPTFYPPPSMQGRMAVKPGGAPDNPLGSRWIGFGDHLGLHGTNEPQSIGKSVSLGCIRMHNPDVEFLYDCLVQGSTVEIVD